jgi:hypothetical protein
MDMATRIHVKGEQAPRAVPFDTDELARLAARLMGLDPESYTLVESEHRTTNVWTPPTRPRVPPRLGGRVRYSTGPARSANTI